MKRQPTNIKSGVQKQAAKDFSVTFANAATHPRKGTRVMEAPCDGNLRRELAFFGQEFTDMQWFSGQLKFVESHTYLTEAARALRDKGQAKNVAINY